MRRAAVGESARPQAIAEARSAESGRRAVTFCWSGHERGEERPLRASFGQTGLLVGQVSAARARRPHSPTRRTGVQDQFEAAARFRGLTLLGEKRRMARRGALGSVW